MPRNFDRLCKLGAGYFPNQSRGTCHHNDDGIYDCVVFGFGEQNKEGEIVVAVRSGDTVLEIRGRVKVVAEGKLIIPEDQFHLEPLSLATDKGTLVILDFKNGIVTGEGGRTKLVRQPIISVVPPSR